MNRREWLLVAAGAGAAGAAGPAKRFVSLSGGLTAQADGVECILRNRQVEFRFDLGSGALRSLGRTGGRTIPIPEAKASPIRMWLGTPEEPDQQDIAIAASKRRTPNVRLLDGGDEVVLEMEWPDVDGTGVTLRLSSTLEAGDDSLRCRATVINGGRQWITGLFLGVESLVVDEDATLESLRVGDVGGRAVKDPRTHLPAGKAFVDYPAGRRSYSVPPTVPMGLIVSWMDVSAPGIGVGTAYLDRQEMDLVADVRGDAEGMTLGWRLFRLEGSRGFLWGFNGPRQIYPLAPGEQFTSDEWLLTVHGGDWHRTARAYRRRYEVVLAGDYANWDRTSPAVRDCDVVLNSHIAWGMPSKDRKSPYDYPNGRVINRFDAIAPQVREAIGTLGIKPAHVLVNVLGTATEWGIYRMPDHFPLNPEAGGQEAGERMVHDLRALGVAGVCFYAHPYFHHKKARNYVASADSGLKYPHQDWDVSMGAVANMADEGWQRLWREEIFPRFHKLGVNGLYFDEGFGHQFLVFRGADGQRRASLPVLTEQSRGATALYHSWRMVSGGFSSCESGSDVQARWIDLWHFGRALEHVRYTHPDKLIKVNLNRKDIWGGVGDAWLMGCPLIVAPFPGLGPPERLEGELLDALKAFVRARASLRERSAPGYPQGFEDTDDLVVPAGSLRAKVFRSGARATIAYFAPERFEGDIAWRSRKQRVRAAGREFGFVVFE